MLFTLIRNELIKLMKKSKTWIVFALFTLFIGVSILGVYNNDKNTRQWQSPENQLAQAKQSLEYTNADLDSNKEDLNPEYIEYLESTKAELENKIKAYEDMIKNGVDEDAWKLQLEDNIKWAKESIESYKQYDDEWSKKYLLQAQEELDMYLYLKENNIQPLYGWEYESFGYMKTLMQFLGMAILVSGIAVFMSDIVSGECTPATLKFLLVQPVSRGKILLSKFIAVVLTVITMIMGGELIGFIFVKLTSGINASDYPVRIGTLFERIVNSDGTSQLAKIAGSGYMGTNLELFIKAMLYQALFIITACSVIFLISTLIKSSMVTMATSVILTVFLTIGSYNLSAIKKFAHLLFVNYADSYSILTGSSVMMFENPNMTITNGIIVMLCTAIVSYLIAHFIFKRKDILI